MIIACLIISGLALLAAVVSIVLYFVEKKRNAERRQALLDYINNYCESISESSEDFVQALAKDLISRFETEKEFFNVANSKSYELIQAGIKRNAEEIEKLKNGAVPDYEKAMEAAKAVNDFNAGISAIMNYDPIETVRSRRQNGEAEVS